MPQLQVVNTGGNFMNTALGNISAGFIDSFNKRSETARNDEIFSRIKSKYGPDADPDMVYKDILQSEGFDQSYKQNLLKMVSDYATLQKNKEHTRYEQIRLDQMEEELKLKKAKASEDPATKPMTPYQKQTLENRQRYLDLQEQKLNDSISKGSDKIAENLSKYSNAVFRLANKPVSAQDKALVDTVALKHIQNGSDIQSAFQAGLDALSQKAEFYTNASPPGDPRNAWIQPSEPQIQQAKQALYNFIWDAVNTYGIREPSQLREIAARGKWPKQDTNEVIQKVLQNPNQRSKQLSQEEVNKVLFQ